jgi:hypothetical protein
MDEYRGLDRPVPECPRVARADGLRAKHMHGVKKKKCLKRASEKL